MGPLAMLHGGGHRSSLQAQAVSVATLAAAILALARSGGARRLAVQLAILGVRSSTVVALGILARNVAALARTKRSVTLRRALWYAVSTWSLAEACFLVYIFEYKRRLDSQTSRRWQAVTTHSTEEKRTKSMERYLLSLSQVCKSGGSATGSADGAGAQMPRPRSSTDERRAATTLRRAVQPSAPAGFPRKTLSMDDGAWAVNTLRSFSSSNSLFGLSQQKHDASVDDLLKLWEGNEHITDTEVQKLKLLELASFFTGPARGDSEEVSRWLRRGNVEDWVAHYWFRGAHPEHLNNPRERQELSRLVDMVLDSAGLIHLPTGRNPGVQCIRTFSDPLPVLHRPLIVYLGSSLLAPLISRQVMQILGFHRERVGGLAYWKRDPRRDVHPEADLTGQAPMVFVHGLGVGLMPYYLLIYRLSRRHSGDLYVPEFPFLAMAPWESVPSAREVVAQLQDMLAANGHTAAHFAGHSFGSVIIGWVMKMSASSVIQTTLMEPAQFLMMKSECLAKVLYGPPKTCYEMLIRYFGFRELFTVNLLCRNLFWEQSTMWPEDITMPALIELGGGDHIVQSLFVRRLLEHERAARKERRKGRRRASPAMPVTGSSIDLRGDASGRRADLDDKALEILWCDGLLHGEILFRTKAQDKLFSRMRQLRVGAEPPAR